jgi:hypothetical protein
VIATGENYNFCLFNLVDKTVFTVLSAGPATGKLEAERFRLAGPLKRSSPDFFKKCKDSISLTFIRFKPIRSSRAVGVRITFIVQEHP